MACLFLLLPNSLFSLHLQSPVVAGAFYPDDSARLRVMLDQFYDRVPELKIHGQIFALISPHAGYIYSGQIAAFGYKLLKNKFFDCIILIGPSHHYGRAGAVVDQRDGHETPLGVVNYDKITARKLLAQKGIFDFQLDVFREEHSIEVQLPFLQTAFDPKILRVVEIIMTDQNLATAQALAKAVVKVAKGKKVLVIASSDLSHYHPHKEATILDKKVATAVRNMDEQELCKSLASGQCEACGGGPIMVAFLVAKALGADESKILCYANSGDVTGDSSAVVGYLSAILYKKEVGIDLGLDEKDKKLLKALAQRAIEKVVKQKSTTPEDVLREFKTIPERLKEIHGVFVTINKSGMLRGCIGRIIADKPLYYSTAEMAIAAATEDPRFMPIEESELKSLTIEISVLTPLKKVKNADEIKVGRDGLFVRRAMFSGLLLPQVATEYGWDKITFLEETCQKAGLPKDAWKDTATEIYTFSAQVF